MNLNIKKVVIIIFSCFSFFVMVNFENNVNAEGFLNRKQMYDINKEENNKKFQVPNFNKGKIKNIKSAKENGKEINIWDSWPIQDGNGKVINYKGYNLVVAMGGNYKLYLFYRKSNSKKYNINQWKFAGRIFSSNDYLNYNGRKISQENVDEWSGSTTYNKKRNNFQLFYTSVDGPFKQELATATFDLRVMKNKIKFKHRAKNNKVIFDGGNGKYYQNQKLFKTLKGFDNLTDDAYDNFCLRDPHYIEEKGKKYLIFEASTGYDNYQGDRNYSNNKFFGGSSKFRKIDREKIKNNPFMYDNLRYSNATIGVVELNNDYSLKKVKKPLVSFNSVSDEIERPNIFKYNGKWYLFVDTHKFHFVTNDIIFGDNGNSNNSYMLGFSSNSLFGKYKPLNKNGLVLFNDTKINRRDYTYSYYPIKVNNKILITSYASSMSDIENGPRQTFAPSYTLKIKTDKTSTKNSKILGQGALNY